MTTLEPRSAPFRWRKLGLVYDASRYVSSWRQHSALTPTPLLRSNGTIRVYAGFRDRNGVSRIAWVDLDPTDPAQVLAVSSEPVLDIGRPGCFDDNGVILGDVLRHGDRVLLFYVGFQQTAKAKFLAFSGVAESTDDGDSFTRLSEAPILDRADGECMIAAIHSAHYEDGRWRLWYASGDGWQTIGDGVFPRYGVSYVESADLRTISDRRQRCLEPRAPEYRLGRPRVYHDRQGGYVMHFTAGTIAGAYMAGAATSTDGLTWTRVDAPFELAPSPAGWDSRHLSYPAILTARGREYMFYNGNDMGRDGFGVAVRESATD